MSEKRRKFRKGDIVRFRLPVEIHRFSRLFDLNPSLQFELAHDEKTDEDRYMVKLPKYILTETTKFSTICVQAETLELVKAANENGKATPHLYTASVTISAPTREQAHAAAGMMLRTDANMFNLHETPYTAECNVDWESLRVKPVEEK